MARWAGNTRGRLERAALELFTEQGYDHTTVAQIAQRAGLTERTFYRWFPDKREVLFGVDELETRFLAALDDVPPGAPPLPALLTAFATAPEVFRPREFLRARAAVIAANPPLQEREIGKLAALGDALTAALGRRGCPEPTARLATDAGLAVLRLAAHRWGAGDSDPAAFPRFLADGAAELLAIARDAAPG